eukprot:Gb_39942 [translate_table: standard]
MNLNLFLQLAHLVEMEVKHRCNQILELGFPLGGVAKLFAQEWEGDVTIVMPATLAQFAKIIQNPTHLELQKAANQGRRCTWEKLSAIKANCGIELVLDECVSFLNRMRRQKKHTERTALQGTGNVVRFNAAKRIPSWNCMARESSWGSLDEDGLIESVSHQGGPWGGPSGRTLRFARNTHDGSDSESENADLNVSWTRIGGPLMRTASATKFIQSFDVEGELSKHWTREDTQLLDNSELGQYSNTYIVRTSSRDVLCNNSDCQSKLNRDRKPDSSGNLLFSNDKVNHSDAEDQGCSVPGARKWGNRLSRSPSRIAVAEGDLLLAERSPNGTVLNVVKREDITLVDRIHDLDTHPIGRAFSIDDCIQLDSPGRDNDEDNTTAPSECGDLGRDSDASTLVADECSPIKKQRPDEFFLKVERSVDLTSFCRQFIDKNAKTDLSGTESALSVKEMVPHIENEFSDQSLTAGSEGCLTTLDSENQKIGFQSSKDEVRAPQFLEEPFGSNDKATDVCNGSSRCLSEDEIRTEGDNCGCIDKVIDSANKFHIDSPGED